MKPSPSATLSMREESHTIAKSPKPKVRIVHIIAPEIIKTDPANFRNIVQKLTGNHAENTGGGKKKMPTCAKSTVIENEDIETCKWMEESYSDGEVDGFFQGLTDYYLLPPMSTSSHMDLIGEGHVVS